MHEGCKQPVAVDEAITDPQPVRTEKTTVNSDVVLALIDVQFIEDMLSARKAGGRLNKQHKRYNSQE